MIDTKLQILEREKERLNILLKEFSSLDEDERYKRIFKAEEKDRALISAVVWLLSLREKAKDKFREADKMFFTSLGLEQATDDVIASHIAKRFKADWQVADLGCGLGGNLLQFAKRCKKVIAVDVNEDNLFAAKLNVEEFGFGEKVEFVNKNIDDFIPLISPKTKAIFLDPARDRAGNTKTRSILNSSPKILEILPKLFQITKNIAIKISPAFDWQELELLPEMPEVEVISENNTCKVVMLWFGEFKRGGNKASCFRKDKNYTFTNYQEKDAIFLDSDVQIAMASKVLEYICEPDKAISRSGLLEAYAGKYNLKRIAIGNSYLTGSNKEMEAARVFAVKQIFQLSLKNLKQELKKLKIDRAEILAKNYIIKPEEIYKHLKLAEGGEYTLIFAMVNKKKTAILTKRVK